MTEKDYPGPVIKEAAKPLCRRRLKSLIYLIALIVLINPSIIQASEYSKKWSISSDFGWRINPITNKHQFHKGIDIPAPLGTPIASFCDGEVIYVGWGKGHGWIVRIIDKEGVVAQYGHLSLFSKKVVTGAFVKKGQIIGCVGSSGMSTGPHLDFKLYKNKSWIDPINYFRVKNKRDSSKTPAERQS